MMRTMKVRHAITLIAIGVSTVALRSAEAAQAFGGRLGGVADHSLQNQHPFAMVLLNMAGIVMILGVSAIAFATLVKNPGER